MKALPKLTISIVNFNAGEYLIECLRSIQRVKDEAEITVIVVDNASTDGSIEKAQQLKLADKFIKNSQNLGFSKAHNIALRLATSEYILILNPDTKLENGVIREMIEFMESHKEVGAATCMLVHSDSSIDFAAHRGFPTPLASLLYFFGNDKLYHLSNRDLTEIHEVDAISGSFFLTRKSILEKVGYFDENYFMYAEDIDLCFRIKKVGLKVMYVPTVKVIHYKGVSSGLKKHSQSLSKASYETRSRSLNAFYETMKIFYKKHYEKHYPFFINWIVYMGINLRWLLAKRRLTV